MRVVMKGYQLQSAQHMIDDFEINVHHLAGGFEDNQYSVHMSPI